MTEEKREVTSEKESTTTMIPHNLFYAEKNDIYEGTMTMTGSKIKINIKKRMEPLFWDGEFTMDDLVEFNKYWRSLLDENLVYFFIGSSFDNSTVKAIMNDETDLVLSFPYHLGFNKTELALKIKRGNFNIEAVILEQGTIIKTLYEENKSLKASLVKLKDEVKKCDLNEVKHNLYTELTNNIKNQVKKELYNELKSELKKELLIKKSEKEDEDEEEEEVICPDI